MRIVIKILFFPYYIFLLIYSCIRISINKKRRVTEKEYQALLNLFLISGGYTNEIIHFLLKRKRVLHSDFLFNPKMKILNFDIITENLKTNGFYQINNFLSDEVCDEFLKIFINKKGFAKIDENPNLDKIHQYFNRRNPQGTMFFYEENTILEEVIVQNLMIDKNITEIAQKYFGSMPILSAANLWWSTSVKLVADKESAQYYHFDMDTPKWLKFFIYITDVEKKNGPHTFVKGSHLQSGIPLSIRNMGYSRIDDDIINKFFDNSELIEFAGKKGTLIIEDTRGLHKGKNLEEGDRLILQFEFTSTNFIKSNKNRYIRKNQISKELQAFVDKNPEFLSLYL